MIDRLAKLLEFYAQDTQDAFTRYGIALEYRSRGELEQARTWLEALRGEQPDYVPTYYQLAELYRELEQHAAALVVLNEGIAAATRAGDGHARAELQAARDELEDEL